MHEKHDWRIKGVNVGTCGMGRKFPQLIYVHMYIHVQQV